MFLTEELYFEPPKNRLERVVIIPNHFGMIIRGNYNLFRTNVNFPAFYFRREGVAISPDLKVVTKDRVSLVEVFNNYDFFILVTIPPLVGHLQVGTRVFRASSTGLPSPRGTPVPQAGGTVGIGRHRGVVFGNSEERAVTEHINLRVDLV